MSDVLANMFDRRPRAYFILSSKRGEASLSVEYPAGMQDLMVPIVPSNAVHEYLPYLEPAFAHYVAQWDRIMVPNPTVTDARGFWVPSAGLPGRIADPANAAPLFEVWKRHVTPQLREYWGDLAWALHTTAGSFPNVSDNNDEVCESMEDRGVVPWTGS